MNRFVRFHTSNVSSRTGKPQGLFAALHFLELSGRLAEDDASSAAELRAWFKANVPDPPFYEDGNSIRAITWFKSDCLEVLAKAREIADILRAYDVDVDETVTDAPGSIVYEDEFQVGVVD